MEGKEIGTVAIRNTVWRWSDMRDQRRNRKAPLEQFAEGWLLWGNFAPKTREWYGEVFRQFLGWMEAKGYERVLGELEPEVVRLWQRELEEAGRSVSTVRGYLAAAKSFSRYLCDERFTLDRTGQPINLLSTVKVPKLPKSTPEAYKDEELERIIAGINPHTLFGARNIAMVRLMLDGGLRLNEVVELQEERIDWQSGVVHVVWASAKRRKERYTWVGRKTLQALKRYRDHYRPQDATTDTFFVDEDGEAVTTHAVQCVMSRLKAKLNREAKLTGGKPIKRLHSHKFRRTWATNYRRLGAGDLLDLQREGGWEDLEVPQRFYIDASEMPKGRVSVMDRWEQKQRKEARAEAGRTRHNREVTPPIQVREVAKTSRAYRSTEGAKRGYTSSKSA